MVVRFGFYHLTPVINLTPSKCLALESCFVSHVEILLEARRFMIEREQSPFPNQLTPARSDSWAIVYSAPSRGPDF